MSQQKDDQQRRSRKVRIGVVTSNKMDKTAVVAVERQAMHPVFHKTVRLASKVKAHDEKNVCQVGDRVQLIETRPLSKHKRWRVHKVLTQGVSE